MVKVLSKAINFLKFKLFKKNIVTINGGNKRALLYYKTDVFIEKNKSNIYRHTNNHEIIIMVGILSRFGYSLDVIDRTATMEDINQLQDNHYDLYISNNAGNGARYDEHIIKNFNIDIKIGYAAGPEPGKSVEITQKAHDEFIKRNKFKDIIIRRLVVYGRLDDSRYKGFDAILGVANQFSKETFLTVYPTIKFYRINPALSVDIEFNLLAMKGKKARNFFYFGGNGLITKGLDLVLEAFDGENEYFLEIGGPEDEKDFWNFYKPLIHRNKNIHFNGFMDIHSSEFNQVCQKSAFVIFASSSEGIATSVLACQRAGLIPIVTYESGIDIEDFGFIIKRDVKNIKETIKKLSAMDISEIKQRSIKAYLASLKYSPDGFRNSFEKAIIDVLGLKGKL